MRHFDGVFLMLLKLLLLHAEAKNFAAFTALLYIVFLTVCSIILLVFKLSLRLIMHRIKYSSQTLACRSICVLLKDTRMWSCYMIGGEKYDVIFL